MNKQIKPLLWDIKTAANSLFELTRELTLLQAVSDMALQVMLAVDKLAEQTDEMMIGGDLETMADSESIGLLDEIVDVDVISELEEQFFSIIESLDGSRLGEFLSELLEKIERRYTRLVEAIHQLNVLLGE